MTIATTRKQCQRCTLFKPVTDFHANRTRRDGRCDYCKACQNVANAASRAKRREAGRG